MSFWRDFHGPNAGYILELYEHFQADPESVDAATRAFFERWTPPTDGAESVTAAPGIAVAEVLGAVNLAQAIRSYGHLGARLDPLGSDPPGDPELELSSHGITAAALERLPASLVGGPVAAGAANAAQAIEALREIYSGTIGYDYDHITIPEERAWLRDAAETRRFRTANMPVNGAALLDRLTQVETFEQFLHRMFPGKHRFSIEGLDMLVPILDEIICSGGNEGIQNVLIGMAHRGRLNVMAHVLNKPYAQILAEFKDPVEGRIFRDDLGWTGDVKYHKGAYRPAASGEPCDMAITLAPNPSHLEAVNPVIAGMVRAAASTVEQPGAPGLDPSAMLAVLIHGDAAFPAQGVVAETLNLSHLPGYWIGGTVHIIANNQLGYTTLPGDARSTWYASTLAKGFKIPIVHVNADDPEACLEAARLAFAYHAAFRKDFVIDLIGYRRHGHNEGDEPAFTQPVLYSTIRDHPTVRERWAATLSERGEIAPDDAAAMVRRRMDALQATLESLNPAEDLAESRPEPPPSGMARRVKTAVGLDHLQKLNDALLSQPDGFHIHPKLQRARDRRREALADPGARAVDWATAEELALASILADGVAVRFTGQDTQRGTFNQRHAVLHDTETGQTFTPLQAIPQVKAAFEILNSPLTENAVLGFEFGYNIQAPERLVLWEAQYGDFINGAQVIIDEFLSSARAKWGQTPSLVLLLPHGYEGAGPDHSSGRLERFLQLTGEKNMRIANCTSAAQIFHLLRRQAALLKTDPLPLVVMTPKSLLRHPMIASSLRELAEGQWQPVIDDEAARQRADDIRRLFLCSGKIYVDLLNSDHHQQHADVAVARVEQLYPFPEDAVRAVLDAYPNLEDVVWVQEEPENMGAWTFVQPRLDALIADRWPLRYVGRAPSSSPAEGSAAWHAANQATLLRQAYDRGPDTITDDFIIS